MGNRKEIETTLDVLWAAMRRHESYLSQLQERIKELEAAGQVMTEREVMDFTGDVKMPEPEKVPAGMNFLEACKAMEEGKKVKRADWNGELFLRLTSQGYVSLNIGNHPYFTLDVENALATDWEVYEDGV